MTFPRTAIILAAGRNDRLAGICAPSHKPLLVVNGLPLLRHAFDTADALNCKRVVLVAAPSNVAALLAVVPDAWSHEREDRHLHVAIQREPRGIVHAARIGMQAVPPPDGLVALLCSDNLVPVVDRLRLAEAIPDNLEFMLGRPIISAVMVPREDARRLTWLGVDSRFHEHESEALSAQPPDAPITAWVGPLIMTRTDLDTVLGLPDGVFGESIGRRLNLATHHGLQLIGTQCSDIGVPEALS